MNSKPAPIWMHLLACACFLALPFIMRPGNLSDVHLNDFRTIGDLIVYVLIIGFFYLNYYLLVPRFYFNHRYSIYLGLVFICFLFVTFVPDFFQIRNMPPPKMEEGPPPRGSFFFDKTSRHFFIFAAVCLFSLLLKINLRWRISERQKLSTELSFLRAQINPHFLFNTLNSIYSLAVEKSDETATAVVKLSGMMRYVLNETGKDFVPLKHELEYVDDYIALQQLRFGNSLPLTYTATGNANGKLIAPLLLMSFIENAFKHGYNAAEKSEIKIEINVEADELSLFVHNKKVTINSMEANSGVGITNTKKRLALLYPAKHSLAVTNDADYFSIQLKLSLA